MRIEVTQRHIDEGTPTDPCGCPVYLAIRDACAARGIAPIYITTNYQRICFRLTKESDPIRIDTPPLAAKFINRFDGDRRGIRPFAFELDLTPLGFGEVA